MLREFTKPPLSPWFLDRYWVRQSILNALKSNTETFQGIILDVGCGQMPYRSLLVDPPGQVTQYIGLDLADNPVHQNQPDICWQEGRIPLADASVDCALCTEVLEHCPEPEAVLSEIRRVLRPGGRLFFTVPFLWPLHEVPYDYYRYTPFALQRHLENTGFSQIELHPLGGWDASLAQMIGLWVRRRPMRRWQRRMLSWLVFPLYCLLIRSDRPENRFRESVMLTGLWGIAIK
jgi:SAM-dependent methyltransferase